MAVEQLPEPCWVRGMPGEDPTGDDMVPHYLTKDEAIAAAASPGDPEGWHPSVIRQETEPCWVARCKVCGEVFSDEEDGGSHFESPADLIVFLVPDGWRLTRDGETYCYADAPECETADLAAEIPGQLTLTGKEDGDE